LLMYFTYVLCMRLNIDCVDNLCMQQMCEQADERLKNAGAAQNGTHVFSGILCLLLQTLSRRS